jgi:hypothetical protein
MIDRFRGEYRWLSNFHECRIQYLGLDFPTTEHAYQAAKRWDDPEFHQKILSFPRAGDAMRYARTKEITTRDWHSRTKFNVMEIVNFQKFHVYPDLRDKLLATGDQELVEGNDWGDRVWGVCDGVGENRLGVILMKIRRTIRTLGVMT